MQMKANPNIEIESINIDDCLQESLQQLICNLPDCESNQIYICYSPRCHLGEEIISHEEAIETLMRMNIGTDKSVVRFNSSKGSNDEQK